MTGSDERRPRGQDAARPYEDLYEEAPHAYFSVDEQGRIERVNARAEELTGYDRASLLGKTVLELYADSPAGRERARQLFERYRAGERISGELLELRRADGTSAWVELSQRTVQDRDGRNVGSRGILVDVTERERATQALRRSEQRFRRLFEESPVGNVIAELDLRIAAVNRAFAAMVETDADDLRGRHVLELVHPDHTQTARGMARAAEEEGAPARFEKRLLTREGTTVWSDATVCLLRDGAGRPEEWLGIVQDVSERQRSHERDRRRAEQLEALARVARDVMGRLDPEDLLPAIPEAARQVLGARYAALAVVGRDGRFERLIPAGVDEAQLGELPAPSAEEGLLGTVVCGGEVVRLHDLPPDPEVAGLPPGHPPVQAFLGIPIVRAGEVLGALYLCDKLEEAGDEGRAFDDLDESMAVSTAALAAEAMRASRLFQREREVREEHQRLAASKDLFLTAVSHEILTPLTSISGFADLLQLHDDRLTPERRRALVDRLLSNAARLETLVRDLLDLDRLRRGAATPQYEEVDLAGIVGDCLERTGIGEGRPVELDVEPVVIAADARMVKRIVDNLVTNAARHTPPGTPVWIRLRGVDGGARLVVEDAGPGVPPERSDAIFAPFDRGAAPPEHAPGIGIGLALVRFFAELHGGSVTVRERPGGGAAFTVFLPARAATDHGSPAG